MKTILLIDDSPDIRENTAEILTLEGYKVLAAENGQIGVEMAIKEIPDLILCDIMMPVLDGFGVFLNVSKNLVTAGIPFIFLTAKADIADKKYGINLGVDDYVTKPYDDNFLLSIINARLQKHEKAKKEAETELFKYLTELEDMLHLTNHKVRAPLCSCLGLIDLFQKYISNSETEKEIVEILTHINSNILSLDGFTKDLTRFIEKARHKKRTKLGILPS